MKKTKVLIPATAVLALGMAAAVTGTVAWFSSNTEVSATGMSISATTSETLMISETSGSGFQQTVNLADDTPTAVRQNVMPVSPVDYNTTTVTSSKAIHDNLTSGAYTMLGSNLSFFEVNLDTNPVNDPGNYRATTSLSGAIAAGKIGNNAATDYFLIDSAQDNYVKDDLYLLYTAPDVNTGTEQTPVWTTATAAVDLSISISLPNNANIQIWKALHLGVLQANAEGVRSAGTVAANDIFYDWDVGSYVPSEGVVTIEKTALVTLTSAIEYHFQVFAWFEGEDTDCKSAYSLASVTDTITFNFALAD